MIKKNSTTYVHILNQFEMLQNRIHEKIPKGKLVVKKETGFLKIVARFFTKYHPKGKLWPLD